MAARRWQGIKSVLQIVCIIALCLLLVGILFSEISRTALALRRDTATPMTLHEHMSAVGYVFRDEQAVSSVDGGAIAYSVASGSTVTVGTELALVYADGSNTGTRARAAEITAEIERLQALDDPNEIPDYNGSYEALMSSLSMGAVLGVAHEREVLQAALDRYAAVREQASARAEKIAALKAELEALIENDRNACDRVSAPVGGVFYREADGYESVLSTEAVETLTPGGLRALLASPQGVAQTVGKIAMGGTWYLAVPTSFDQAKTFAAGSVYEIAVKRTGECMKLTLARITEADTSGEVLLIFRADQVSPPSDLARCEEIEIVTATRTGIFIPMVALREENGAYTVFVDENGVAAKRKIEPILIEDGYCLATQSEAAEYLQQGEQIVVTPRHIYEGKALK